MTDPHTLIPAATGSDRPVLSISELIVGDTSGRAAAEPTNRVPTMVHSVTLDIRRGHTIGLVGESGSGKTLTALAAADLLPAPLHILSGTIGLAEVSDLGRLPPRARRRLISDRIGVIFQNPTASLNPRLKIAAHFREVLGYRHTNTRAQRDTSAYLLEQVGIRDPGRILRAYPHELSGGLNQRVAIALALSGEPAVLIADEPTTALDVTVQARILDLIDEVKTSRNLGVLLISHDLDVIADRSDEVHVMADGRVIESGITRDVLADPQTPQTRRLIASRPRSLPHPETPTATEDTPVVTRVENVRKVFTTRRHSRPHVALDGVSLQVHRNESVGLVGESGSGKTTLARIVVGLNTPDSGHVSYYDNERRERGMYRTDIQYVFQNAYAALDPNLTIAESISEPLRLSRDISGRAAINRRVSELADEVDLSATHLRRRPTELSGGQCQRAVIARALANEPRLLVADEPVSALDLSVQARILGLFTRLRDERNLSYLFISHDLDVVSYLCERVLVMQDGIIVESGTTEQVLTAPRHTYTRQLIAAVPGDSRYRRNVHHIPREVGI
ncbi:MAG: ABC transporter ATP-binding protein [Gordonia sp. (in: high G+C Gram-positive bacteria)]